MLGRKALLAATNSENFGNWLGNYSDVSLLLRNGTQSSTLVPFDESPTPKTITAVGNASATTAVAKWNQGSGGSSLAFDGSGDWLTVASSADLSLGTGDFTVELWAYANNTAARYGLVGNRTGSSGDSVWCIVLNPANSFGWGFIYFHTDATAVFGSSVNFSASTWMHIAVTRSGTSMRMFLNGAEVGTVNNSFNLSSSTLHVGSEGARTDQSSPLNGFIDDLRITKGIARYETGTGANAGKMVFAGTNTLALPTAELPANITDDPSYNSVSLLLRNGTPQLAPFDESPTPKAITAVGNAGISTTVFKYGTSSLAFDGASRFQLAASSAWDFSGGPHTFECWVFLNAYPNGNCRFLQSGANGFSTSFIICNLNEYGFVASGRPSGGSTSISSSIQLPLSQWVHVALVLNGATTRLFVNGVGTTASVTMPDSTSGNLLHIGQDPTVSNSPSFFKFLNGYIDDLRITRNFARYTSNFTPPPAELPNF